MLTRIIRFIKYNPEKKLSLLCWYYSAIYRYQILNKKSKDLHKEWGEEGKESPEKDTPENYKYALKISGLVNEICSKTSWESKCLVRALTAQTLLKREKIHSTLYLGCKKDEKDKMIAHAWIRCGEFYVTGGNGSNDGYVIVDQFFT